MAKILVTGGAGYIGSHAALELLRSGHEVVILDNLVYGHEDLVRAVLPGELVVGSTLDRQLLDRIFQEHDISAVMHFAAYAYVGESVHHPTKYYENNVVGSFTLLRAMLDHGIKQFIFSSTCATYGIPHQLPIPEDHPQQPINPYGKSKLMVEQMLADLAVAHGLRSVIFRYFNAAGADPQGRLGEDHQPETHLIPLVLLSALDRHRDITILGTDYDTFDGTCIRDYIHVSDLATAHLLGLEYLLAGKPSQVFNLGNGNGFSVRQVIDCAQQVTGRKLSVKLGDRRQGDPPVLLGSSAKAREVLQWQTQYPDLETIISHAWQWHQKRHGNPPK
jgi:UDP-glucose 4-epimerase